MKICIGSRDSRLAVIQSRIIIEEIKKTSPDLEIELLTMKTTGDIILNQSLDKIGGKGLFVKELDKALREGRSDLSVHSLKDVPMEVPPELPIVAYSRREDPRDALVLKEGLEELDLDRPVGCSSLRRALQLKTLFPGIDIKPVRGNVLTRLEKLDRGEFGALVLAAAGLKRLGLQARISRIFEPEELMPAAGQGILAIQGRRDMNYDFLAPVNDPEAAFAAEAERAFVKYLDGGCSSPVAAYAQIEGEMITLSGLYYDEGSGQYLKGCLRGRTAEAKTLGFELAEQLKQDFKKGGRS